jgi:hypothetical protein
MQYRRNTRNTTKYKVFSTFLNCEVLLAEAICSGARYCEYLHPLLQGDHNIVSTDWEHRINSVRTELYSEQSNNPLKSNTEQFAATIKYMFQNASFACQPLPDMQHLGPCTGHPIIHSRPAVSSYCTNIVSTLLIGLENWQYQLPCYILCI